MIISLHGTITPVQQPCHTPSRPIKLQQRTAAGRYHLPIQISVRKPADQLTTKRLMGDHNE
jgi:hypothetical protein